MISEYIVDVFIGYYSYEKRTNCVEEEQMPKSSTNLLIGLLIGLAMLSCSNDNPTDSDAGMTAALVGIWDRTTTKADGVVVTAQNDTLNLYEEEVITLKKDNSGKVVSGDTVIEFTWEVSGDMIMIKAGTTLIFNTKYKLSGNTLTLYFPSEDEIDPDVEYVYTRR